MIRLGVNIDHVATVRNARGTHYPDPCAAAVLAELGGADNITCHLREDRRHIRDEDVQRLKQVTSLPLNLEMAVTEEMIAIALKVKPAAVTLVPEKRAEMTTEGGLDLNVHGTAVQGAIHKLKDAGIKVSLFVEPDPDVVKVSAKLGADAVELHTGTFCRDIDAAESLAKVRRCVAGLQLAAEACQRSKVACHVGHGLHYQNTPWLQYVPGIEEANIGHAIVARAILVGFQSAVSEMKAALCNPDRRRMIGDDHA